MKGIKGFTLIELLIALLLLSTGLLAFAYLQVNSLRSNHVAHIHSQAAILAADMADRIQSNAAGVAAGNYNSVGTMPSPVPDCETNVCTAAEMAEYDAAAWLSRITTALPNGTGTVTGAGSGSLFTITVSWSERAQYGQTSNQSKQISMQVMG